MEFTSFPSGGLTGYSEVPDRKFVNPTTVHCINDDPKHCQVPRCHLYNLVNPPDGKLVNPTNVQCINDDQKQVPSVICIILVNPPDGKLANPTNVRCINDDPKQVPPVICIILSFVFCTSDFESVRLLYWLLGYITIYIRWFSWECNAIIFFV